jgi:hypothetical protein
MADTAAALVIQLSADFKDFKKQMQAATGVFDAEGRKIERRQAALKKNLEVGFGRFGSALSAAAVIGFGRSILNTADALSDASQQLGITTQQLQGLDYAARVSGASSEKLVQALSFLSDGLGEAQRGEGQLAKFMRENNVAMGTTVEVLYDVADRVKNATTQTEKMNIATTALGAKGGKSMVSFLNQGADGLRRLQAEGAKKGQIWDKDTIAKLDAAKDSFETLQKALVTVAALPASQFMNDLVGLLNAIGDGKVIEGLKKLGYIMPVVAGIGVGGRVGGLVGAAAGGTAGLAASWGLHKLLGSDAAAPAGAATVGGGERSGVPMAPADKDKAARDAARALGDALNVSELLSRAGEDAKRSTDAAAQSTRDLIMTQSAGLLSRSRGWVDYAAIQKEVINETAKLDVMAIEERKLSELRSLDVRSQEERNRLGDLNATLSDRKEFEAAYLLQRVNLENIASTEIKAIYQRESDDIAAIRTREIEVSDAFRSSLLDIGSAALDGFGTMKDAAASALEMIAKMILQMYVLEPLVEAIMGPKGTTGGGIVGSIITSLFADGGVMTPSGPRKLKRYASGGTSGNAAIFGEAGPEAAVPLPDGRRIPVELRIPKMPTWGGSAGGVTVTQNFDLSGAVMTDELFARVDQRAKMQASAAVASYDRGILPQRVRTLSGDPRRNY